MPFLPLNLLNPANPDEGIVKVLSPYCIVLFLLLAKFAIFTGLFGTGYGFLTSFTAHMQDTKLKKGQIYFIPNNG
jgi:hypothetical protein